jgi:RNA-directed DNA polymerase
VNVQTPRTASPRVPVRVSLAQCHTAWLAARRGKKPSANQLRFASRWLQHLQHLQADLGAGTWVPRRTVSFVVNRPKTREIHAPDFADRVVHHWLVPQLEALYEPVFIHDSYANRRGKGSHAAVDRLQAFMRAQQNTCGGKGWFLQLDVHNFFNTIHRPTLYRLLTAKLDAKAGIHTSLRSLCHKLLAHPLQEAVRNPEAAQRVPPHKRLCNAPAGCGLPIGNLTSQFFANVYLNELDQFVKHSLKVRHYVRYVDDFVLLADNPAQLRLWHRQIAEFLQTRLHLKLKDEHRVAPLQAGVDFLGYVVYPHHRLVRRRVVQHCKQKLAQWAARHCRGGGIHASAEQLAQLQHMLASYWGHFAHAHSVRLRHALFARYSWLRALFHINPAGHMTPRWVLQGTTLTEQVVWLRQQWPHAVCEVQKGFEWLHFAPLQAPDGSRVRAAQTGWLKHGTRRREITDFYFKEIT